MRLFEKLASKLKTSIAWWVARKLHYRFYMVGGGLLVIWFSILVFRGVRESPGLLFLTAGTCFALGFIAQLWPIMKQIWKNPVGKVFLTVFHLAALLWAEAMSRHIVASALGLPPGDFGITLNVFTAVCYIPSWIIVALIMVAPFLILFLLSALISSLISDALDPFRFIFGKNISIGWDILNYKLFATYLGLLFIFFTLVYTLENIAKYEEGLYPYVRYIAFVSDFQPLDRYPGIPKERVKLHENGVISVAYRKNDEVVIEVLPSSQ